MTRELEPGLPSTREAMSLQCSAKSSWLSRRSAKKAPFHVRGASPDTDQLAMSEGIGEALRANATLIADRYGLGLALGGLRKEELEILASTFGQEEPSARMIDVTQGHLSS